MRDEYLVTVAEGLCHAHRFMSVSKHVYEWAWKRGEQWGDEVYCWYKIIQVSEDEGRLWRITQDSEETLWLSNKIVDEIQCR